MKLSVSREILLKNLRHVQSVVEKRNSIAILANVRLKAEDDKLEMTATDNDLTVQGAVEAFVDKKGATTVGAHKLFEIISKVPDGVMVDMELAADGNRLMLKAGKSKFSLACLAANTFPDMTRLEGGATFSLESMALKRLMEKSQFATAADETRQFLNGVYLHVVEEDKNSVLRAVATDGHRLAQVDQELPKGAEDMPAVILPKKTIAELKRLAEENKEIKLHVTENKIQAEAGEITLTSKVIDGNFPDYTRVIPQNNTLEMGISVRQLLQAVERVSILSHEKSRSVKFTLGENNLMISANNPDQENAQEELKVNFGDKTFDIGFNAKYVADVGGQAEGEDMQFFFKDSTSPVLVKDPVDQGALFVVMPMRI